MNNKKYNLSDIAPFFPEKHKVYTSIELSEKYFSKISTLNNADKHSLVFIDHFRNDKQELFENTNAGFIICDFDIIITGKLSNTIIIQVDFPKLVFSIIGNTFFVKRPIWGAHPTSFIHAEADVDPESYIGAFTYIGKSKIGKGTIVYGNCYIYDNVKICKNVIIQSGTVIGSDGFGYNRLESGIPIQFPHIGDVLIDDLVEIGANVTIDLGALGTTKIGFASKIDNLVHIGHNVEIGRCCYVAAQSAIAGSSVIEDFSEIWVGCKIADGTIIGQKSSIGIGSVIIKSVPENKKVFGNPGRIYSDK